MNCRIFLKLQILCLTLKLISTLSLGDDRKEQKKGILKYKDDRKEQKTGYKRVRADTFSLQKKKVWDCESTIVCLGIVIGNGLRDFSEILVPLIL